MQDQSYTAVALSHAYASGRADPVEITEAALERAALAPAVFISMTPDRARAEAAASARRWKQGMPLSALDGVPVAWKDLFDIADTVTTAGSAVNAARPVVRRDAPLVAAAARAGLVAIGKTNLSEFAYSGLGLNPHFGTPVNPALDHGSRVPGGSSSGAAVAVATGIVPIAIGTDTGGSVRIPAAFNGVTGYRASTARYPRTGMTALSETLDTSGPLARTVEDCICFDALVRGVVMPEPLVNLTGQRFIVDPALTERYQVSDTVAANHDRFVDRLCDAGARIETRRLDALKQVHELIRADGWLGALEAFALHRALLDSADAVRIDPRVRARLETSRGIPADRREHLLARRLALIAAFRQELGGATLVMPCAPHVAPLRAPLETDPDLFARVNLQTLSLTMPGSFLDTPAFAIPSGVGEHGLPTGVQLMRAQNDDDALCSIAWSIERLTF
ncbi:amidase [Caballeronia telluris]|uniref:Amidase n=1 Tax=Caballeronia telluris TaxID=326475 RepID=A0A158JZP5_9BURK|nr:amidase [Caballeronia telluris]SAL73943.1 amidase [Caballeronia telluris]